MQVLKGKNIKIRKATIEDSKRIWEIRNAPTSRKVSRNKEEIPFEKHDSWFQDKYFSKNTLNQCYVLDNESVVIGYCRFDYNETSNYYIVSIALDSHYQGKALGTTLLSESIKLLGRRKTIVASIFQSNLTSIRLFEKTGFKFIGEEDGERKYQLLP
jgi:UDP-2,4-diacetamido-2,4,6-trideoxy-beta-L-altropyranose hydrolase